MCSLDCCILFTQNMSREVITKLKPVLKDMVSKVDEPCGSLPTWDILL